MKCYLKKKTRFSTQTTRKLFVGLFFPRLLLLAKKSEEGFVCVCVSDVKKKMFLPLCLSVFPFFILSEFYWGKVFRSEDISYEMQNYIHRVTQMKEAINWTLLLVF